MDQLPNCSCINCGNRCQPLTYFDYSQQTHDLKESLTRYNSNLDYWNKVFVAIALNTEATILDSRKKLSLCSPKCFEEYIEPHKADIVMALARYESVLDIPDE